MKGKIQFQEKQSFVGTWMWYLVIGISILSVGGTALSWFHSHNSEALVGLSIASISVVGVITLFSTSRLEVIIDEHTLYYKYPPFICSEKQISREDIKEIYVRNYKPLFEYGGWGYRTSLRNGKALNISGDIGLQLVLKNDKRLLIGTQKKEAMEQAVRRLKENWGING
ncbi:MAG: hypothetical protein AAF901_13185 [Bacteroidota bacterium]